MKYCDYVEISKGFQTSVNLEYDLNNIDKIEDYIPTEQSVNILGKFLRSYYYDKEQQSRASVLIGPYGRGKSHLLLVLSALTSIDMPGASRLSIDKARQIQNNLCARIEQIDNKVGALAKSVVTSNIRTLPVIINSNTNDINQAFLISIYEALTRNGLQSLLPVTHFDSAANVIDKWREAYTSAYQEFIKELKKNKVTVDNLYIGLKQYNSESYNLFCKIYPAIAAGAEFNPLMNVDVVKYYSDVTNALCEQTKYSGINIIFDEFSKFIEANLDKSKMLNFKIIQDMAEIAVRSNNKQIHFTCVTHKEILDYSTSDSFKAVEGRFNKIYFLSSIEQSYDLVSNAIIKKTKFEELVSKYEKSFKRVSSKSSISEIFRDYEEDWFDSKLVYGCFPLTPLSTFSLLHISELVGQNERSLFTFISQYENYSFNSFLQKDINDANEGSLEFITVDYIYSYFEEMFRKEIFNTIVHNIWIKTDSAMQQVGDTNQLMILKAIAIIKIIADNRFTATPTNIKAALLMDDDIFEQAIKELLKKHILSQRDSTEYVLLTANGVDIQKSIDNYINTKIHKINHCEVLGEFCDLGFVIPREYNDKYCMLRFFKNIYMDAEVFLKYSNIQQIFDEFKYDGLIVHIIEYNTDKTTEILNKLHSFNNHPQLILCLSTQPFIYDEMLKRAVAVSGIKAEANHSDDTHYLEEVEIFEEDIKKQISSKINEMYAPHSDLSNYYNCNGKLNIISLAELSREISKICGNCYNKTPIINNEMVNKNVLNSQNLKGRDRVVSWLFQHTHIAQIPCMSGFGPEVSIFKSVFEFTGLDGKKQITDSGICHVLATIKDFIISCELQKRDFELLYDKLTNVPYGVRKGIIPLFISYSMLPYKENIVIYFGDKEVELSSSVLSKINTDPKNYQLFVESGTGDRDKYLDALENTFMEYKDTRTSSINRIYDIVRSMQNWIRALPEYTKKYCYYLEQGSIKPIETNVTILRNELLKYEINSREFLYNTLVTRLCPKQSMQECVAVINAIKNQLDKHLLQYQMELSKKLTKLFIHDYKGGLSHSVISWYQALPKATKEHLFDANTNALLAVCSSVSSYDDISLLNRLIESFTAIAIEDWNDELAIKFEDDISSAIARINNYRENRLSSKQDGRIVISLNNTKIEKTFETTKITPLGQTVLNNLQSVLDEYNESITPDEQLVIITKLVKDNIL